MDFVRDVSTQKANRHEILWFLLFVLVSFGAVSSQSLWIDEANSALKAIQPTLADLRDLMIKEKGSDLQMLGYMLMLWGWEKIAGSSEWVLRSFNLLWLALGLWALLFRLRQPLAFRVSAAAISAVSSFTWAYLDEVRPYAMQIGSASLVAAALVNLCFAPSESKSDKISDYSLACIGAVLLSASSLIGAFFCGFFGIAFAWFWFAQDRGLVVAKTRPVIAATAFTGLLLASLGLYYLWTLKLGAGASDLGKTGLENVAFAGYELSGLAGLGPGRLEIRAEGLKSFLPFLTELFAGGLVVFLAISVGCACGFTKFRTRGLLFAAWVILAASSVLMVGYIAGFRVLGRHMTPIFPFVAIFVSACLFWPFEKNRAAGSLMATLLGAVLIASSVTQRFNPRFAKDDYRSACHVAKTALDKGQVVWWAADGSAPKYYGTVPHAGSGQIIMVKDKTSEHLETLRSPQMIFLSKPDVYDAHGAIRKKISAENMSKTDSYTAFTIWETVSENQRLEVGGQRSDIGGDGH